MEGMEGGRRELRIKVAPGPRWKNQNSIAFLIFFISFVLFQALFLLLMTTFGPRLAVPSFLLLPAAAVPLALLARKRLFKTREVVVDIDFLRLEEEGRVIWRTGWADIAEYHFNATAWKMIDDDGRTFQVQGPGKLWVQAVGALSRSGAICYRGKSPMGPLPLALLLGGLASASLGLLTFILPSQFWLRNEWGIFAPMILSLFLIIGFIVLNIRRSLQIKRAGRTHEWIKGEREVTAADLYPIRSILDGHPRAFVHKDVASDVRLVFRDGEALIEGSRRPADHLKLDDFVEEAEGSQLAD